MPLENNVPVVPLLDPPPWLANVLLASDEKTGSQTCLRGPERILIIEDDLLIATQIEITLTEAGFKIVGVVTTGDEAIEVAGKDPPHLAIMDIRLAGGRDGIDTALELFRQHGIRCIFASAYSDREARQRAAPAAPLGWLQKPYSMATLTAMVRTAASEVRDKANR